MNLFDSLRGSHGQECVKSFRRLEKLEKTRARFQNHLRFNLRCRDEDITPRSLNLKNPIPTSNAANIINRAKKALVKERIRATANKLDKINARKKEELDCFKGKHELDPDTLKQMNAHLTNTYEQEFAKTKQRQIKKLNKLIENNNKRTRGKPNEKWVRNLSERALTDAETRVLSRGLNYAVTPTNIPHDDFILATELACHKIQDLGK